MRKRQGKKHLPTRMYFKNGKYYYVPRPDQRKDYDGKSWIPLGAELQDALDRYDQYTAQKGTIAEIWGRYSRKVLPKNADRTQKDKQLYWARLKPVFGTCSPYDIRPKDIYDYLDIREEDGGGVQGNREIALLSHMYTKAIRWGLAEFNPCLKLERNEENTREKVYVTDEMLSDWLKFAPRKLALYAELEFMIGARCSDVLYLRLSQLEKDGIRVTAAKTKKQSVFPWSKELRAVIRDLKALRKNRKGVEFVSDYLFLNRKGKRYTKSGFDSVWQRNMVKFAEKGFTRFAMSDMRAKHASDLDDQGGNATRNLQHSNPAVTNRHYLRKASVLVTLPRPKVLDK